MSRRRRALGLALVVGVVSVLFGAGCDGDNNRAVAEGTDNGRTVAEGTVKVELGRPLTVKLSAKEAGDQVNGTAEIISDEGGEAFSIQLECAPERNDVLILGGRVSESSLQDVKVGTGSAVLLKQGEPDRMLLWFADAPPAGDCDAFARDIAAELPEMLADENAFQPVQGDIQTG
jgi:hypothetical protein